MVYILQVMLNGKELETVDSSKHDNVICLPTEPGRNVLDILVENLGRVNYASFKSSILNEQHKGINCSFMFHQTFGQIMCEIYSITRFLAHETGA